MPKYELKLSELLTDSEMEELISCINGEKDLMIDFPDLYDKLFDFYSVDMPYGTAKARTGDPVNWIIEHTGMVLGIGWEK